MSSLSLSTGLISGLDISALVDALALNQQRAIDRLSARNQEFEIKKTGLDALEANLLTLNTSVTTLKSTVTFEQFSVSNSDESQFKISAAKTAQPGNYAFQAVQKAVAQQSLSRGFTNTDEQTIGTGTLTITQGGFVNQTTLLETLNDGAGVRRGSIRITDRSGSSANIDLSKILSVNDVLDAINTNVDVAVKARVVDGQFVIEDLTGSSSSNLTIVDLNGGNTAADLGIAKSVSSDTLAGDDVYELTANSSLEQINDGNGLRRLAGAPDLLLTLRDGTELDINLDEAVTLGDVIASINDHEDNAGKLAASIVSGRIVLTDNTGGSGELTAADQNDSTVVRQLGLDATASGATLTGNRLGAGLNDVLLRNLRGGQGISELGELSITDRSGQTATIDLSAAETLNDIIETINAATGDLSGDPLLVEASINSQGNGIVIADTSDQTVSNLIITDVNTATLAEELNLEFDSAENSVASGSLNRRFVNESDLLTQYAPDGGAVQPGLIQITDTDGNVGVINITTAVKNIGDVLQRINANTAISVRAELNETGDGFVLVDEAGGTGTLLVEEFGDTTTAADLRLLDESTVGTDGFQRISSRLATVVEVEATDTLEDVVEKINQAGAAVNASLFNDGSTFNPNRISLTAEKSGRGGRWIIDDGDLNLGFNSIARGQNAILQVGAETGTAFLLTSETNSFDNVVEGIDIDLKNVGSAVANVDLTLNTDGILENIQRFISGYNQFVDIGDELVKFDPENNQRGILQGDSVVQRVTSRLNTAITGRVSLSGNAITSLAEIGIRIGEGGKLVLNEERLQDLLDNDLERVKTFFTDSTAGFAQKVEDSLKSLTDIVDGTFTFEKNVLNTSISLNEDRISELNILLENRKTRLLNEFVEMENILSSLQTQQTALANLKPVTTK